MLKRVLIGVGLLAIAHPAFAQAPTSPAPGALWTDELALRPPTLPTGMVEIHGSLPIFQTGGAFANDTVILGGAGLSYGVSEQIEIGGDYAFEVSPDADATGVFAGHALIRLVHDEHLSAAVGLGVLYSHAANDDFIFTGGLAFRYRLNKQLSIFSNTAGMPICGSCIQLLGPVTGQFLVARESGETGIVLNLPVGIGFQVNPQLYLFGETVLATLVLSPSSEQIVEFSDYFGVHAGLWYSASKDLELGAGFADDLKHSSDIYLLELRAKIYIR